MPVAYNTIEVLESHNWPAWSTVWQGIDGCANRTLSHLARSTVGAPASSLLYYEPISIQQIPDNRHLRGKRSGYPPYRYTSRYVSQTSVHNWLVRRRNGSNGYNVFYQYGSVPKVGLTCTPTVSSVDNEGPFCTVYDEVTAAVPGTVYDLNTLNQQDVTDAEYRMTEAVSLESIASYDVLTDIAEAREIPRMGVSIANDISNVAKQLVNRFSKSDLVRARVLTPKRLLRHAEKAMRKIGGQWMQHRYGIMPLVYSYRDIRKTLNHGNVINTRKGIVVLPRETGISLPAHTTQYKWSEIVGQVNVRASAFQFYNWTEGARLAHVAMNPLVTAWELLPYSFVFDWFVNMGDYITRKTNMSISQMQWACVSRRDSYTKKTWVHFPNTDKTITFGNILPTLWWGSVPPATPSRTISRPEEDQLLKEEKTEMYYRRLFRINDARLRINPNLHWRRGVDAYVMAHNLMRLAIKKLRH